MRPNGLGIVLRRRGTNSRNSADTVSRNNWAAASDHPAVAWRKYRPVGQFQSAAPFAVQQAALRRQQFHKRDTGLCWRRSSLRSYRIAIHSQGKRDLQTGFRHSNGCQRVWRSRPGRLGCAGERPLPRLAVRRPRPSQFFQRTGHRQDSVIVGVPDRPRRRDHPVTTIAIRFDEGRADPCQATVMTATLPSSLTLVSFILSSDGYSGPRGSEVVPSVREQQQRR
jgi:hypothetical protein